MNQPACATLFAALTIVLPLSSSAVAGIVITVKSQPSLPPGWKTWHDPKLGFEISYPPGWKVDPMFVYAGFEPHREIHGVAFTIPVRSTTGTNLSPRLTGVSVESVDGSHPCDAERFLPMPQDLRTLHNGGRIWSTANMQDAAAGNLYDMAVFALPTTHPCLALRYVIHSTNPGNYEPGTVKAFDRAELIRTFATIRHTLRLRGEH